MGRELKYKPGSFYRVDDRTGIPTRAEKTKREWDGLIVAERVWEPRQPQDYVRGVRDDQTVPDPRPVTQPSFYGPLSTELSAASAPQVMALNLLATSGLLLGAKIWIVLDTGDQLRTVIDGFSASGQVLIRDPLPAPASAGNTVTVFLDQIDQAAVAGELATEDGVAIATEAGEILSIGF